MKRKDVSITSICVGRKNHDDGIMCKQKAKEAENYEHQEETMQCGAMGSHYTCLFPRIGKYVGAIGTCIAFFAICHGKNIAVVIFFSLFFTWCGSVMGYGLGFGLGIFADLIDRAFKKSK